MSSAVTKDDLLDGTLQIKDQGGNLLTPVFSDNGVAYRDYNEEVLFITIGDNEELTELPVGVGVGGASSVERVQPLGFLNAKRFINEYGLDAADGETCYIALNQEGDVFLGYGDDHGSVIECCYDSDHGAELIYQGALSENTRFGSVPRAEMEHLENVRIVNFHLEQNNGEMQIILDYEPQDVNPIVPIDSERGSVSPGFFGALYID